MQRFWQLRLGLHMHGCPIAADHVAAAGHVDKAERTITGLGLVWLAIVVRLAMKSI